MQRFARRLVCRALAAVKSQNLPLSQNGMVITVLLPSTLSVTELSGLNLPTPLLCTHCSASIVLQTIDWCLATLALVKSLFTQQPQKSRNQLQKLHFLSSVLFAWRWICWQYRLKQNCCLYFAGTETMVFPQNRTRKKTYQCMCVFVFILCMCKNMEYDLQVSTRILDHGCMMFWLI